MTHPDWKSVTTLVVQNHKALDYGYVSPIQHWTPDSVSEVLVGGRPSLIVDVGLPELVIPGRNVRQKELRRWLWELRDSRALSPQRIGRSVVWHLWDQEAGESAFGIAAFSRYDAGERLNRMRHEETVTNG